MSNSTAMELANEAHVLTRLKVARYSEYSMYRRGGAMMDVIIVENELAPMVPRCSIQKMVLVVRGYNIAPKRV